MSYKERRIPYEFSHETKCEAYQRAEFKCEICGREEDRNKEVYLQAHHKLSIWFALENPCLATEVIRSLANIEIVCRECHAKLHEQESRTYYKELAPSILIAYLDSVVDPHLDDWRDKLKRTK